MQIRIGNKQDEASVRELVASVAGEFNQPFDPSGNDSDLKDIEWNYLGQDGIFLVAEDNRRIVAFAGARKLTDTICDFRRLVVDCRWRKLGIGRQLIEIVRSFARRMDYEAIEASSMNGDPDGTADLLSAGFTELSCAQLFSGNLRVLRLTLQGVPSGIDLDQGPGWTS